MIEDGPAEGWSYVTLVPPDPVIAIAPEPREDELSRRFGFMRVVLGDTPWPGQREYIRGDLPDEDVLPDELGDIVVRYRVLSAREPAGPSREAAPRSEG